VRVASLAVSLLDSAGLALPGTFDALTRLIERSPARARAEEGLGVEQAPVTISQAGPAGRLVHALGKRPPADLVAWLPVMDVYGRASVASLITGNGRWVPEDPQVPSHHLPDLACRLDPYFSANGVRPVRVV
jgi:hypothetical protein